MRTRGTRYPLVVIQAPNLALTFDGVFVVMDGVYLVWS